MFWTIWSITINIVLLITWIDRMIKRDYLNALYSAILVVLIGDYTLRHL